MTVQDHPTRHPDFALESERLAGTVASMIERLRLLEDREYNVGADEHTSIVQADKAELEAQVLRPHIPAPYFGSLTVRAGGRTRTVYVGKAAFGSRDGQHDVISWLSPVGALFYSDATHWPKGEVHRRRQLDVRDKALHAVTDLFDRDAGGDTGAREAVLVQRLSEGATTGMRDVVETLQPEQDAAMRHPAGRNLVLQGSAGAGKTSIAFHRLAWLADAARGEQQARPDGCLVLMPTAVLAGYAARVLPSLGLQGVQVTTAETWASAQLGVEKLEVVDRTFALLLTDHDNARRRAAWLRAKAMGHARMLDVLRAHLLRRYLGNLKGDCALSVTRRGEATTYTLGREDVARLVERAVRADALVGHWAAIREALLGALLDAVNPLDAERPALLREVGAPLDAFVSKLFLGILPVTEARRLLGDEGTLREAAGGLLSEAQLRALLSDPLASVAKPRRSFADASELPLMLAVQALTRGIGRPVGRGVVPYDHILADEGQDFSPLLYRLLRRAARPGHVTVLGDLNQGIAGFRGPSGWPDVLAALGTDEQDLRALHRTYRSTGEITGVTQRVAATYNRAASAHGVDRAGAPVSRLTGAPLADLTARAVKAQLQAGHQHILVVTRREAEAEPLAAALRDLDVDARALTDGAARYAGGVTVLPVRLAKGLEADGCVVAGADAAHYDPQVEFESRLLYVAASRAQHALALVAEGELHPLLRD